MSNEVKIGLDLDGVIIDHVPNKISLAADYGFDLEPAQVSSNYMHRFVPRREYEELKERLYGEVTLTAPPVKSSIESLARLPGEVHVISARHANNRSVAWEWLERHGVLDLLPRERVVFVPDSRAKRPVVDQIGIDVYMDDQVRVLEMLSASVGKYLLDSRLEVPRAGLPEDVTAVGGWPEFLEILGS